MNATLALLVLTAASTAAAEEAPAPPPPAPETTAPSPSPESAPAPAPEKPPLGWLSDPKREARDIWDALTSGKIHLDNRFRVELADTTNRDSSTAITNRIRLGYETRPFHGFSGMIEMENVATPDEDNYYVPQTGDGSPARTPVADPPGTEVNQAFARYQTASLGDSRSSLDIKGGRQRIKIDDDRFIGNVGWRQFEQTFDAARITTNLGIEPLELQYAYVWGVQRIFGPDGPNPDSSSHIVHASYRVRPELRIAAFAYLLDFEDDDPANSSDSYGLRATGDLWKNADDAADIFADYELTYAYQQDAGENPVDYQADFFAAQARITRKGLGWAMAGYQFLGSDDGTFAFRFPLGTNHAFQGWADNFLVTPAFGVQDLYVGIGADMPWGIKSGLIYHAFWADEGGDSLGHEFDIVASKAITTNLSLLVKGAFYDGDSGQPDTDRVWFQIEFRF